MELIISSDNYEKISKKLKYRFRDISLLSTALTHSSYANESKNKPCLSNERLEFLGDSVLGLVVTEYVYSNFPELDEGELTKLKSKIVSESTLNFIANKIELGKYILLGKGEESSGGRSRKSILADCIEALIGAAFLECGYDYVKEILIKNYIDLVIEAIQIELNFDYKTRLQEHIHKYRQGELEYLLLESSGPDNDKTFHIELRFESEVLGQGIGKSKKQAEQVCAKIALNKLGVKIE